MGECTHTPQRLSSAEPTARHFGMQQNLQPGTLDLPESVAEQPESYSRAPPPTQTVRIQAAATALGQPAGPSQTCATAGPTGEAASGLNAASSMPGSLYMAHGQCNLCHEVVNQGSSPPQTATDPSMGMPRQWDTLHGAPGSLGALTCSELPVRSKYQPLTGPILVTRLVLSSLAMLPVAECTTPALRDIVTCGVPWNCHQQWQLKREPKLGSLGGEMVLQARRCFHPYAGRQ